MFAERLLGSSQFGTLSAQEIAPELGSAGIADDPANTGTAPDSSSAFAAEGGDLLCGVR